MVELWKKNRNMNNIKGIYVFNKNLSNGNYWNVKENYYKFFHRKKILIKYILQL